MFQKSDIFFISGRDHVGAGATNANSDHGCTAPMLKWPQTSEKMEYFFAEVLNFRVNDSHMEYCVDGFLLER